MDDIESDSDSKPIWGVSEIELLMPLIIEKHKLTIAKYEWAKIAFPYKDNKDFQNLPFPEKVS